MPLTLYADLPARRALQVLGDVGLLLWVWLWVVLAGKVRDATLELRGPGAGSTPRPPTSPGACATRGRRSAGSARRRRRAQALRRGRLGGARARRGRARPGRRTESLAHWLFWVVLLLPVLVVAWSYLPGRVAFVRRATAGRRFLDSGADLDLFALRAMAHQPLHVLARVDDDRPGRGVAGTRRSSTRWPGWSFARSGSDHRGTPPGVERRGRVTT